MKNILENTVKKLPFLRQLFLEPEQLRTEIARLKSQLNQMQIGWPPGHFYSPIPSLEEIKRKEKEIFNCIPRQILGVNLNEAEQIDLFDQMKMYYEKQPFSDKKQPELRYFFENPNYSYGEAIILYCMIRQIMPRRIIEVGSGHSSCAILDINELFFNNSISCTFVEPYPQLLTSLLKDTDLNKIDIIAKNLEDVDLSIFSELSAGDILFIDSTHVSKINSDVNHIFFRVLPQINTGVYIHIHDIYYPFEYPKEWIYQGRAWNEAYLLRAFLQYNSSFKIVYFNSFMGYFYRDKLLREMPLCGQHAGSSIWLKKI